MERTILLLRKKKGFFGLLRKHALSMGFSDDGVSSLVQAVKEHRKFKQLACYSIECVAKVGFSLGLVKHSLSALKPTN